MAKRSIKINIKYLKDLVSDGKMTKECFDLILNKQEQPKTLVEPCFNECKELYFDWFYVKSKGELPTFNAIQGVKLKSIISKIRSAVLNNLKMSGNNNPILEAVDIEVVRGWGMILSSNINLDDSLFSSRNKLNFSKELLLWDEPKKSFFNGMITLVQIDNHFDNIRVNIKNNAKSGNSASSKGTISGIEPTKIARTASNTPSSTSHIDKW